MNLSICIQHLEALKVAGSDAVARWRVLSRAAAREDRSRQQRGQQQPTRKIGARHNSALHELENRLSTAIGVGCDQTES